MRRRLRSAERFSEAAIFFGSRPVKTRCWRSSASLSRVTRADQRRPPRPDPRRADLRGEELLREDLLRGDRRADFPADFCGMNRDFVARTQAVKKTTTAGAALFQLVPLASFRSLSFTDIKLLFAKRSKLPAGPQIAAMLSLAVLSLAVLSLAVLSLAVLGLLHGSG